MLLEFFVFFCLGVQSNGSFWDYICVLCVCFVGVTLLVSIMFGAGQGVFMRILRIEVHYKTSCNWKVTNSMHLSSLHNFIAVLNYLLFVLIKFRSV